MYATVEVEVLEGYFVYVIVPIVQYGSLTQILLIWTQISSHRTKLEAVQPHMLVSGDLKIYIVYVAFVTYLWGRL